MDRQLKEQFIHGFSDKLIVNEIIQELTARNNNEQVTSEGMLTWAKQIEAQRAQAAVLNYITESCQFDKIKVTQKPREGNVRYTQAPQCNDAPADTVLGSMHQGNAQPMVRHALGVARWAILKRYAGAKGTKPYTS